MKSYLNYSGVAVLAHRGGSIESFENTIESFYYSQSLGCKFIETDVQVSSDGIPYIFHDETLTRLLDKNDVFSNLHSNEIDNLRIFDSHKIPRLDETLQTFPDMYFQIDVKTDQVAMPALEVIYQCKAEDRVCIASFNSPRLSRVNNKYPDICLSMGPNEVSKMLLSSFGLYNKTIMGDCLQIPMYYYGIKVVTKRFVDFVHSKGLKICVWTINDEKTFKKLIDMGVDGIITDKPKLLFQVLNSETNQ
jgi:glycerophosphoryl diester phosphodiesterase